jgi:hypothetical protein
VILLSFAIVHFPSLIFLPSCPFLHVSSFVFLP